MSYTNNRKSISMNLSNIKYAIPYFIIALLFFAQSTLAQDLSTSNKKALRAWKAAYDHFRKRDFVGTLEALDKAIDYDDRFLEAYYLKADILLEMKEDKQVIEILGKAKKLETKPSSTTHYMLAKAKRNLGLYLEAVKELKSYKLIVQTEEQKQKADLLIETCKFGYKLMSNPVDFEPINIGSAVNSPESEYWPSLTADQSTLVFTRLTGRGKRKQEDFFVSSKKDSVWLQAVNMGAPMNTPYNEGAQSISADGKTLVFTACGRRGGAGSCDLYISRKTENGWTVPQNMGRPINSRSWESQPSLSADGKVLFFVSNRPGGYGRKDIWLSELDETGNWKPPINLGDSINTAQNETAPFLHPDAITLYFASDGHMGMGRSDVFLSRFAGKHWTKAHNLGYPINTQGEERGVVTNTDGIFAFISSEREGGFGGLDIYRFELPESLRPERVTFVKGIVRDIETKVPLLSKVELINLRTKESKVVYSDEKQGDFLLILPAGDRYALNVWRKDYLFYSDHFDLVGHYGKLQPYMLDIRLSPIKQGQRIVLKNIFFDTDKFELKAESEAELQKLISFLNTNSTVKLEIGGHTDNQGTEKYNLQLSKNRAKAVYQFLLENKIPAERLSYKGYGQSKPIETNDSDEGRSKNRRTEAKIIER